MSIVQTHWAALSDVLDEALDAPPGQRADIVYAAFPDEPELQEEALALLRAATGAPMLLDNDAWQCVGTWIRDTDNDAPPTKKELSSGTRLGPYTIDELVGTGGSSRVYRAHRSDGVFEQVVAIKVLRQSQRTHFETRFLRERSILAALDHPNIARVFDGGTTPEGYPFFVMEHVDGVPITEYCDAHRLTIPERLRLMQDVIEAVQHAHQNLIVHRDLKPSNILVTTNGEVQLLDFGIAKVLDASGVGSILEPYETKTGSTPLTPGYAAPEQIEREAITTRTDVYALGRICYELLSGCRPIDAETTAPYALMQAVCEGKLRPMHTQFADRPTEERSTIAAKRACTENTLGRYLQSDLRAVLNQALACDPDDRYGTAADLGRDLDRYLNDLPVQARSATPMYWMRTFLRRNRWRVVAVAATLCMVLAYAFTVTVYSQQMKAERDKSEAVTTFLTDLFTASDPARLAGTPDITVREVLDRGAARLDTGMEHAPLVRADLQTTLGHVYSSLGLYEQGEPLLRSALDTKSNAGSAASSRARTERALGYLLFRTGSYEEAEAYLQQALTRFEDAQGASAPELGTYLNNLALLYNESGRGDEAEPLLRRAITLQRVPGTDSEATYRHNLAIALQDQGRFEEAVPVHEEAISAYRTHYGEAHPSLASGIARYAFTLHLSGDWDRAADMHEEALAMRREVLPSEHPHIASSLIRYGWLEAERGNGERAETLVRDGIAMLGRFVPEDHWEMQASHGVLGVALIRQGRIMEGRAYLEPVYQGFLKTFGAEDWRTQRTRQVLQQTGGVPSTAASE